MAKLKVILLTSRVDSDGGSHAPNDEITIDGEEAVRLCESGQARPVNKGDYKKELGSYQKKQASALRKGEESERQALARAKRLQAEQLYREAVELDPAGAAPMVTPGGISKEKEKEKARERGRLVRDAINSMLKVDPEQKEEQLWTKSKAPEVAALNEQLKETGIQVDAKERDAAWAEVQKANKEPQE